MCKDSCFYLPHSDLTPCCGRSSGNRCSKYLINSWVSLLYEVKTVRSILSVVSTQYESVTDGQTDGLAVVHVARKKMTTNRAAGRNIWVGRRHQWPLAGHSRYRSEISRIPPLHADTQIACHTHTLWLNTLMYTHPVTSTRRPAVALSLASHRQCLLVRSNSDAIKAADWRLPVLHSAARNQGRFGHV